MIALDITHVLSSCVLQISLVFYAKGHLLQEVEHRMNQEVHRKQQLDLIKTANLEKMLESLGERELRLQCLTEETERSSKIRQLQGGKVKKEIQQVSL